MPAAPYSLSEISVYKAAARKTLAIVKANVGTAACKLRHSLDTDRLYVQLAACTSVHAY